MRGIVRASRRAVAIALLAVVFCAGQGTKTNEQSVQTPPQEGATQTSASNQPLSPEALAKLANKVRHQLVMLPYYNVYDNLWFRIEGRTVTLLGETPNPSTRSSAENVVKHIEGVDKVVNQIDVLPPSSADQRIRRATYQAIYSYGPLFKYSHAPVPPIHIIVKNGRVTLEGVVDSETDKQLAGIQANQVPGTFQVTNNLRVIGPSLSEKKKK